MKITDYFPSFLFLMLLLVAACQFNQKPSREHIANFKENRSIPVVINHSAPKLSMDTSIFEKVDFPDFGCHEFEEPNSYMGGLEPVYPIKRCIIVPNFFQTKNMDCIYEYGCRIKQCVRYLIVVNKEFKLIKTKEEFRKLYVPISTPNEALSYSLAVTELSAKFNFKPDPAYRYLSNKIEDTYVLKFGDDFLVHLFYTRTVSQKIHNIWYVFLTPVHICFFPNW